MSNVKKILPGRSPLHKSWTPYSNRRRSGTTGCFSPFKAPTPSKGTPLKRGKLDQAKQLIGLKEKNDSLEKELKELEKLYTEDELHVHIENLHEYNDIKDVGQMLLGRLAEVEQTTTKSLYGRYGLDLDD